MLEKAAIYLDANAGAPLHPSVPEALTAVLRKYSGLIPNPSSIHAHGREAKRWIAEARERVAASLGPETDPEQIVFTSSGSESNQLAIRSALEPRLLQGERPHWITSPVEHDSTLQLVHWLEKRGGSVSFLPVDASGVPRLSAIGELWKPETALVSLVWVNNETGVVTDIAPIAREVRARGAWLHVDAAQAWGKLPVDCKQLGAHILTFSGHKIGGLSGVGGLWLARGVVVDPVVFGKQEKGRRGGTENLLACVAMGEAARHLNPVAWSERVAPVRDRLEKAVLERIPGTRINGSLAKRVANTSNFSFDAVEGDGLVMALDLAGYSVSSGSACSSGVLAPSHVLLALGLSKAQATAAVRVSLAEAYPWDILQGFVDALDSVIARVRAKR